jgi:hypothetical protein
MASFDPTELTVGSGLIYATDFPQARGRKFG